MKRYNPTIFYGNPKMLENDDGEWVKYEDFENLQEKYIMLRRIIQHSNFKQEVDKLFEGIEK